MTIMSIKLPTSPADPSPRLMPVTVTVVLSLAIGLLTLVLMTGTHVEIDTVTGRERKIREIFGLPITIREYETALSELAGRSASGMLVPRWRRAFTTPGLFGAIPNYRAGGGVTSARSMIHAFALLASPPPPEHQRRLARTALDAIDTETRFSVEWSEDPPTISIKDERGRVLACWPE